MHVRVGECQNKYMSIVLDVRRTMYVRVIKKTFSSQLSLFIDLVNRFV